MNDLSEFVTLSDTTLTTDSRRVAKHFKKRHDQVLRAFDSLECPPDFSQHNFVVAEEPDAQGKLRRVGLTNRALPSLKAQGFPLPVLIGKRRRYYSAEIEAWLAAQIAARTPSQR